jgi:thiol-disulfide isomerase/thioredoxin
MKRLILLLFCAASLWAAGPLSSRRAPGFALMDSSFQRLYDPQDYRGKILIIDFMMTNCPHCMKLTEILEQVAAKYKGSVAILEIVVPPDNANTVRKYISEKKVTVPVLFDCGQVAASYLKATPQNPRMDVPHLFLINTQGWIQNDYGYSDATKHIFEGKGLFAEIDRMLAGASK